MMWVLTKIILPRYFFWVTTTYVLLRNNKKVDTVWRKKLLMKNYEILASIENDWILLQDKIPFNSYV